MKSSKNLNNKAEPRSLLRGHASIYSTFELPVVTKYLTAGPCHEETKLPVSIGARGITPLYGLYRDVLQDRVWFLTSLP